MRATTNGRRGGRRRPAVMGAALLLAAAAVAACSDDSDSTEDTGLGEVRVAGGEAIQIRALLLTSNEEGSGFSNGRVVRMAVEQYGPIHGFDVHVGEVHNGYCSTDGGRGAAETIAGDARVVGVIGTSCSVAAVEAAPVLARPEWC